MNFSEYTLVSFGDSFTMGQDTVPNYEVVDKKDGRNQIPLQTKWKKDCNEKSYTQVIAERMGFKDTLNFGILAGSNERSLTLLESFLRTNPDKKVFVLFSFTSASRFLQYFKVDGKREYNAINIQGAEWDSIVIYEPHSKEGRYTGIDEKSLKTQYTYWRNNIQDVYNHVKDRRMLYYILSSDNVPYVTFDILNDIDNHMLRDNPINYISSNDGFGMDFMYNDDERYVFKEMDFLKSYRQELVDKSPLLTHIQIDDLNGGANFCAYLNKLSITKYDDNNHYYVTNEGGHWNSEGHIEVAKLIEKFINERYN